MACGARGAEEAGSTGAQGGEGRGQARALTWARAGAAGVTRQERHCISRHVARYGMAWYGMVLYGMVLRGLLSTSAVRGWTTSLNLR